jgi:hypothetical protein
MNPLKPKEGLNGARRGLNGALCRFAWGTGQRGCERAAVTCVLHRKLFALVWPEFCS